MMTDPHPFKPSLPLAGSAVVFQQIAARGAYSPRIVPGVSRRAELEPSRLVSPTIRFWAYSRPSGVRHHGLPFGRDLQSVEDLMRASDTGFCGNE